MPITASAWRWPSPADTKAPRSPPCAPNDGSPSTSTISVRTTSLHSSAPKPGFEHRLREPVAGERRHDHIEGVRGIAAVRGGVRELRRDLVHLGVRAGPAVQEHERHGVGPRHRGSVRSARSGRRSSTTTREALVEHALLGSPVEPVDPVRASLAEVARCSSRATSRHRRGCRSTGYGGRGRGDRRGSRRRLPAGRDETRFRALAPAPPPGRQRRGVAPELG